MPDKEILARSSDSQIKTVSVLNAVMVACVAVGSFALSYSNLRLMAEENGITGPLSYIWPLLIDFALVVFSLSVVVAYARAESTWRQWSLVVIYTIGSVVFNIIHAPNDLRSQVVASIAPVSLFFSFELLMNQIKNQMIRKELILSIAQLETMARTKEAELNSLIKQKQDELDQLINTKQAEVDQLNSQADKLNRSIEQSQMTLADLKQEIKQASRVQHSSLEQAKQAKAAQDALTIEQRRTELLNILTVEGDIGASALADRLNTSRGTVYSDLRALSEAGQIIKNGSGWEVAA